MRFALVALLLLHGAVHLLGFEKAFGLSEVAALHRPIARPAGALWLLCASAFFVSAALLVLSPRSWALVAAAAVVLSQVLIVLAWSDAKLGTAANLVVLLIACASIRDRLPTGFQATYERERDRGLARVAAGPTLTEGELARLPAPVRQYLRRSGAVGKPRVKNLRVRWVGRMKPAPGADWMDIRAEQYSFFDEPTRLFLLEASRYGVPFASLHLYIGPSATMQVRVASLVDIVDAHGAEMNQSETVTLFNDMCVLAPATLVDADIAWQELDERTVRGRFTNAGHTVSADLFFDPEGDLLNFVSSDRYQSADGKVYERFPWSTPLSAYRDFAGRRVATHGDAVWKHPEGDLVYGTFDVEDIRYNVGAADGS